MDIAVSNEDVLDRVRSLQEEVFILTSSLKNTIEEIQKINTMILEFCKPIVARLAGAGEAIRAWQIVAAVADEGVKQALCDVIYPILEHRNSENPA